MIRALPLVWAVVLGLVGPARAAENAGSFAQGSQVEVVGRITSPPKGAINEKKMQVAVGPNKTDYTLHFRKAQMFGLHGQKIDEDGLDDGQWVRAEGRMMKDPRRIEVSRVQVIAQDDPAIKKSAFYHPGFDYGYVTSVAGTFQVFPEAPAGAVFSAGAPFTIVGQVSDDTGPGDTKRRIQVKAAGNEWTFHVPKDAPVLDMKGEKISIHEVHKGQWVRASGWRNGNLRLRVERMENVGADEAYQASQLYRKDYPLGYVDPIEGTEYFNPMSISGTVASIDHAGGWAVIHDSQGNDHVVYSDTAGFMMNGDRTFFDRLRVGDTVSVESRTLRFK